VLREGQWEGRREGGEGGRGGSDVEMRTDLPGDEPVRKQQNPLTFTRREETRRRRAAAA